MNLKRFDYKLVLLIFVVLLLLLLFIFFIYPRINAKVVVNTDEIRAISVDELAKQDLGISIVSEEDVTGCEPVSENEVVSMRSYTSQTFKNPDGSFTSELSQQNRFFYSGSCFVSLDKISVPVIEKKDVILNEIPENNLVNFGSYRLHSGVKWNINDSSGELELRDANDNLIKKLPRPFSIDASGDLEYNSYVVRFDEKYNVLNLFVEVDSKWLDNAEYPVLVDPSVTLGKSELYFIKIAQDEESDPFEYPRDEVINTSFVCGAVFGGGDPSLQGYYLPGLEFNTQTIPSDAQVSNVNFSFPIGSVILSQNTIDITRFNNSQITNSTLYPDNRSGNGLLWSHIQTGAFNGGIYNTTLIFNSFNEATYNVNLSSGGYNATGDLQDQLNIGYFALGINCPEGDGTNFIYNDTAFPRLAVTYTSGDQCTYPGTGSWTINTTCNIVTNYTVSGNLIVQDAGLFNISGGTNITFSGTNRFIYIYKGGQIIINRKAGASTGFNLKL